MKKVVCTVVYDSVNCSIYTITAIDRDMRMIILLDNTERMNLAYNYANFSQMYASVLYILKENNLYVGSYKEFNVVFHNIQWIAIQDKKPRRFGRE